MEIGDLVKFKDHNVMYEIADIRHDEVRLKFDYSWLPKDKLELVPIKPINVKKGGYFKKKDGDQTQIIYHWQDCVHRNYG